MIKRSWTFLLEWAWTLWGGDPGDGSFFIFVGACCLAGLGIGGTLAIKPFFSWGWRAFGVLLFCFAGYGMWDLIRILS